jgi:hypothetical protein
LATGAVVHSRLNNISPHPVEHFSQFVDLWTLNSNTHLDPEVDDAIVYLETTKGSSLSIPTKLSEKKNGEEQNKNTGTIKQRNYVQTNESLESTLKNVLVVGSYRLIGVIARFCTEDMHLHFDKLATFCL